MNNKKIRHICGISGGKDSAALAIYLEQQGKIPGMEYYFSDTGCELPETYAFIDKLEGYLGKKIIRLGNKKTFAHNLFMMRKTFEKHTEDILNKKSNHKVDDISILPSPKNRWCTVKMKIEPLEEFVGSDEIRSYIAIRADEHREGYISSKPNIKPVFPFVHDDIVRKDVFRILEKAVGVPEYYKWRSRSGCFFCFFQRREEWVGLNDYHPDLFKKAVELEEVHGNGYTWIEGMTLIELLEKRDKIIEYAANRRKNIDNRTWQEKLIEQGDDLNDQGCLICSL
jgi:hypothetical protein